MDQGAFRTERGRDLERLLTFVDAIVAIAITLLVLPLVDLASGVGEAQSVASLLRHHQGEIWSFLLSFTVIARLWFAQHRAVRHLQDADLRVSTLLVLWTLTIVFLPFPTALVAQAGHEAVVKILYIATMAVSMGLIALMVAAIRRRPQLADGEGLPDVAPSATSAALLVVALIVSLVLPVTSYYALLLLMAESRVVRVWDGWGARRVARHAQPGHDTPPPDPGDGP